jgi:hypothetical protein
LAAALLQIDLLLHRGTHLAGAAGKTTGNGAA